MKSNYGLVICIIGLLLLILGLVSGSPLRVIPAIVGMIAIPFGIISLLGIRTAKRRPRGLYR
jgi:hypothetical protein